MITVAACVVIVFIVRTFTMIQEVSSDIRALASDGHRIYKRKGAQLSDLGSDIDDGRQPKFKPLKPILGKTLGNYEPKVINPVPGPGEGGKPVTTSNAEKRDVDRLINEYGFNQFVSDKISLDRNIPDLRKDQCKYWHYPEKLPTTSVIIVFHNEGWSTLMRTVHSVFNRSPAHLLKEIVLVDDFSTKAHLKQKLDDYIKEPKFLGKVKIHRNSRREGLIRARIIGARHATAEVLLWLDAHCEAGYNWLPPLLTPIAENRTTAVCPIVDVIDNMQFRVHPQGSGDLDRGGFDWSLYWKHFPLPQFEKVRRKYPTEPYRSPAMAGGLFAMDREFFFELGAYDEGLEIWGGENFELSFKIWMCGGSLLWVPCSRVGHVYRILGKVPYGAPNGTSMLGLSDRNLRRVVEVWMDEYKEYFYRSKPESVFVPTGDLEKQLEFRRTHNCKSFDWFMKEVAPDITSKYPFPPGNVKWGEVRAKGGVKCIDSMGQKDGGKVGVSYCHGAGGNQLFKLTSDGQFRVNEQCAYESSGEVHLKRCTATKYQWKFDEETSAIYLADIKKCIELNGNTLTLAPCDSKKTNQQWEITNQKLRLAKLA